MSEPKGSPRFPPRWFIRRAWFAHRRLYRLTGGRLGLWRPKPNGWGDRKGERIGPGQDIGAYAGCVPAHRTGDHSVNLGKRVGATGSGLGYLVKDRS